MTVGTLLRLVLGMALLYLGLVVIGTVSLAALGSFRGVCGMGMMLLGLFLMAWQLLKVLPEWIADLLG